VKIEIRGEDMKKWSFMVEVNNLNNIKSIVKEKTKETIGVLGTPDSEKAIYSITVTFYQKKDRWLKDDPSIPRQDWGIDLDLKFDGL
jgi:coenzyme F420-reducing hydrogenase beta subunit